MERTKLENRLQTARAIEKLLQNFCPPIEFVFDRYFNQFEYEIDFFKFLEKKTLI